MRRLLWMRPKVSINCGLRNGERGIAECGFRKSELGTAEFEELDGMGSSRSVFADPFRVLSTEYSFLPSPPSPLFSGETGEEDSAFDFIPHSAFRIPNWDAPTPFFHPPNSPSSRSAPIP